MSKIYASQLFRVAACPGSNKLALKHYGEIPQDTSAAEAGNRAHKAMELYLNEYKDPAELDWLEPEELDWVREAIELVTDDLGQTAMSGSAEHKIYSTILKSNIKIDHYIITRDNVLKIYDYKFGKYIVEPKDNQQLLVYALELMNLSGNLPIEKIELIIVQPRTYHRLGKLRKHTIGLEELGEFYESLLNTVNNARSDNPELKAGPHCFYCPARHICKAAERAEFGFIDYVEYCNDQPSKPEELTERIDRLRAASDYIRANLTALEAIVTDKIKKGDLVPGWTLQQGYGHRKWSIEENKIKLIADLHGVTIVKESLETPAGAERNGLPKEVIEKITEKPLTTAKLVRDLTAEEVFKS